MTAVAVLVVVGVLLLLWAIATYNRLVGIRNQVQNGWRQIGQPQSWVLGGPVRVASADGLADRRAQGHGLRTRRVNSQAYQ
jgi:hypothetical protein